jgi:hypothetical protein
MTASNTMPVNEMIFQFNFIYDTATTNGVFSGAKSSLLNWLKG